MLGEIWKYATRLTLLVGLLLTIAVAADLVQLFLSLYDFSPPLGTGFAVLVLAILGGGATYFLRGLTRYPRPLSPPPREASKAYARYLCAYLGRLSNNPSLGPVNQNLAAAEARRLEAELKSGDPILETEIRRVEADVMPQLLAKLRNHAEAEVRRCVRDVMLGVAISPYRGGDFFIVLYRNGALILRVTAIYTSRPSPVHQILVLRDVVRVMAAVNFLNLGSQLTEKLLADIPVVGRFADDIAQGLGAGFFTSAAGHALIERCEAYKGWDRGEAIETLGKRSRQFLSDVRDMFNRDVLPHLRDRIGSVVTDLGQAVWEGISDGISSAVDSTASGMDAFIVRPIAAGSRAAAGATATGATRTVLELRRRTAATGRRATAVLGTAKRGVGRGARSVGRAAVVTWKGTKGLSRASGELVVRVWPRRKQLPPPPRE